jgi:hypothetical protein
MTTTVVCRSIVFVTVGNDVGVGLSDGGVVVDGSDGLVGGFVGGWVVGCDGTVVVVGGFTDVLGGTDAAAAPSELAEATAVPTPASRTAPSDSPATSARRGTPKLRSTGSSPST